MKTVDITICTGTTCYVMGACELLNLKEQTAELPCQVEIKGASCLGLCKEGKYGKAPFARVNEQIIENANIHKIVQEIKKQMNLQ